MKKTLVLEGALLVITGWCAYHFFTSPRWDFSFGYWAASVVSLLNLWVLGLHWIWRCLATLATGVALVQQLLSHNITNFHLCLGCVAVLATLLLCKYQNAADTLWLAKTIVVDWIICTVLIVVCACVDVLSENQFLGATLAYFCSSNILGVLVMKSCEALMKWRSPPNQPCARYIHNLIIPIHMLPSLHLKQLLALLCTMLFLLWARAGYFLALPNGGGVARWHLVAATGLWSSLFAYMCPIIADKQPVPYYPPQRWLNRRQQS